MHALETLFALHYLSCDQRPVFERVTLKWQVKGRLRGEKKKKEKEKEDYSLASFFVARVGPDEMALQGFNRPDGLQVPVRYSLVGFLLEDTMNLPLVVDIPINYSTHRALPGFIIPLALLDPVDESLIAPRPAATFLGRDGKHLQALEVRRAPPHVSKVPLVEFSDRVVRISLPSALLRKLLRRWTLRPCCELMD